MVESSLPASDADPPAMPLGVSFGPALLPTRPPQEEIPPTRAERDRLLGAIREYLAAAALGGRAVVPPLSFDELWRHAENVLRDLNANRKYLKYAAVLVNNEVWRETVAGIPYTQRLLLLPQCLRDQTRCRAQMDEFGLICRHCGACPIGPLTAEARRLGYVVLVAEGSAVVTNLIETGKVHAVVGVSCLSVLEGVFPYMEAGAVPGIAIPLLQDGCANTTVDLDWLWDAVEMTAETPARRVDLAALREQVASWFAPEALEALLGATSDPTEAIARGWLARSGKRWRPFLAVCAAQAFRDDPAAPPPEDLRRVAVAVECFHKASLIHDDIEDDDALRYGRDCLHVEHGVPVALNVGDYLLGEGYRLIAACAAPAGRKAQMLRVAAEGHRRLCAGQGRELLWRRDPRPLSVAEVIEIFRQKTSPAFEVALRLGAIHAGAPDDVHEVLSRYSDAVGIAYQIRDDLQDLAEGAASRPDNSGPSVLLAIAHQRAGGASREPLEAAWRGGKCSPRLVGRLREVFAAVSAELLAQRLLESYKTEAICCLKDLSNPDLKALLRRVVGRIFNDVKVMGCCRDHPRGNAARGPAGGDAVA